MGAPKGNQNASKHRRWKQALERSLARLGDQIEGETLEVERAIHRGLGHIADQVVQQACEGQKDAWMEIANRMDGKPIQSLGFDADDDGDVLPTKIEINIVRPQLTHAEDT